MHRKLTYRRHRKGFFIALFAAGMTMAMLSSCTQQFAKEMPYASLEARIRAENDWRAVFTWSQYRELMDVLSDKKFHVTTIEDFRNTFDSTIVMVGMRHDIDANPFKALEMADIERHYNFRATYYVLSTADYYGKYIDSSIVRYPEMDYVYRDLVDKGAEIGVHNDLLTVMIKYNIDPLLFNLSELAHYDSIGIHVTGTASHGSQIARETSKINYEMFSDFARTDSVEYNGKTYPLGQYSLREYGYEYEAYHVPFNVYYSESGGTWKDPKGFEGILEKLKGAKPGDRIQILTHPDWWGRDSQSSQSKDSN